MKVHWTSELLKWLLGEKSLDFTLALAEQFPDLGVYVFIDSFHLFIRQNCNVFWVLVWGRFANFVINNDGDRSDIRVRELQRCLVFTFLSLSIYKRYITRIIVTNRKIWTDKFSINSFSKWFWISFLRKTILIKNIYWKKTFLLV